MTKNEREEQRALKIAKLIIDNGIVSITGDFNRALRYDECIQILANHIDDYYGGWQGEEAFLFEIKDLPTQCGFEENISYNLNEMKFYLVEDENEIERLGLEILKEDLENRDALLEYPLDWIENLGIRFVLNSDEQKAFDNFLQDLKNNHFPRYSGYENYGTYPTFDYDYVKGFEESYQGIKEKVDKILLPFSDDTKEQLLGSLELGIYVKHILDYVPKILPNYDFDNHICDIHPKWEKIITNFLNAGSIESLRQGLSIIQSLSDIDIAEDEDEYLEAYCMAEYIKEHYMNDPNSSYLTLDDLEYSDLDYDDRYNFFEFLLQNVDDYGQPYHFDLEMVFDYFGGVDYNELAYYESQFRDTAELFYADRYDDDGSPDKYRELAWLIW